MKRLARDSVSTPTELDVAGPAAPELDVADCAAPELDVADCAAPELDVAGRAPASGDRPVGFAIGTPFASVMQLVRMTLPFSWKLTEA
jgi:hypothetical protein